MEKAYPVIAGAESFFFQGNEIGILICHGFNATPQSVRFLGEQFARAGLTVYGPRLKGHGTHFLEMEQCHFEVWIDSLFQAYDYLRTFCREIYLIGQSMGGLLALELASRGIPLDGIITINAALSVPGYERNSEETVQSYIPEDEPDINAKNVHEIVYDTVPVTAIRNLLQLAAHTKNKLSLVSCPALILKSKVDHVVPPENSDFIFERISSVFKRIETLENSYHVASMDYDKQNIVDETISFIKSVAASSSIIS